MKKELMERIIACNRARAADREAADDLNALLRALPPGQVKQLLKDAQCAAILTKYGITGKGSEVQ